MKDNKNAMIAIAFVFLAVIYFLFFFNSNVEKFCSVDSDCACGTHMMTGECFYGNKNYVNVTRQCPDFCNGIAAHLEIKCVANECKQISILK